MENNSNNSNNSNNEFWRDKNMDIVIQTIIDIFHTEGVELVRLNGLTKYLNKKSDKLISLEDVEIIISKLNFANIINYQHEIHCPHCKEISYVIIPKNELTKLCDTCNVFYQLIPGQTLIDNIARK